MGKASFAWENPEFSFVHVKFEVHFYIQVELSSRQSNGLSSGHSWKHMEESQLNQSNSTLLVMYIQ